MRYCGEECMYVVAESRWIDEKSTNIIGKLSTDHAKIDYATKDITLSTATKLDVCSVPQPNPISIIERCILICVG